MQGANEFGKRETFRRRCPYGGQHVVSVAAGGRPPSVGLRVTFATLPSKLFFGTLRHGCSGVPDTCGTLATVAIVLVDVGERQAPEPGP